MATLVLTAAGSLAGGPIGGAIGSILGQSIDASIFAPKPRQGPRLGELAVQTSSYGSAIPKIFGRMRVAGTVIWSTDLIERRGTSGGGKGRPKTVNYSYSASFAVALSGRPIAGVGRIWADGKLLRGAGGDFKSETGFRLCLGGEDQAVDPLIAAAEGIGEAPAYRGIAYALFEDMQLADFGNRIPSLSFEVIAEAGPVAIGQIAGELSGGALTAGTTPALDGYAATGDSARSAIAGLAEAAALSLIDDGSALTLGAPGGEERIAAGDAGTSGAGGSGGRSAWTQRSADAAPGEVSIAFYDPARDWQTGLQRATIGGPQPRTERMALPAALGAGAAKALAERRLATLRAGRAGGTIHLPWRRCGLLPGTAVGVDGIAGRWRIERRVIERLVVSLELMRLATGTPATQAEADPGRPVREPDLAHGPTRLHLMDLPLETDGGRAQLLVAAAGSEAGWRRAMLSVSHDGGASWEAAGPTAAPAVMGEALTAMAAGGAALIDTSASVEIELLNESMWLESRDDAALIDGANLALLGDELMQFGRADPLGAKRFRLSRLLRGRRGTEWAAASHAAGERFVLIEREALAAIDLPVARVGGAARVMAEGIGDGADPPQAELTTTGEALRPPAPASRSATIMIQR